MVNEIAKQEFIDQLNRAFDYAQKNGLSYGICAWVGDAFEDADKEPFDKTHTPWHVKNTEFYMKTSCFDEKDRVEKLTFFILKTLHEGLEPGLVMSWSKLIQDECKQSAAKFITNLFPKALKEGRVHFGTEDELRDLLSNHDDDSASDCDKCDDEDCPNNPKHNDN